jgi:hypothetical protein
VRLIADIGRKFTLPGQDWRASGPQKAQLTLAPESVFKFGFSTPDLSGLIHFAAVSQ